MKIQWHKFCPLCGAIQCYSTKYSVRYAIEKNTICKSCAMKERQFTKEWKKNISKAKIGTKMSAETKKKLSKKQEEYWSNPKNRKKHSQKLIGIIKTREWRKNLSESLKGHIVTKETKFKISEKNKDKIPWNKGKSRTVECCGKISKTLKGRKRTLGSRKKQRITNIKNRKSLYSNCYPNYNPKACKLFETLNENNGWNLQHAENGGEFHIKELGYWVDAIDFKNKIIIEYDEKKHFKNGKLKEKDIIRQQEIEELYPNFKFIRINENKDE